MLISVTILIDVGAVGVDEGAHAAVSAVEEGKHISMLVLASMQTLFLVLFFLVDIVVGVVGVDLADVGTVLILVSMLLSHTDILVIFIVSIALLFAIFSI